MRISARDIQVFVAGALALIGFRSLLSVAYYVSISEFVPLITDSLFGGLALWIAIAMLFGSVRASFWARIYFVLAIVSEVAMSCLSLFSVPGAPHLNWWRSAYELLLPAVLLWLLVWSRSERFLQSPNNALEPTATTQGS